jgi:hypothetical protein
MFFSDAEKIPPLVKGGLRGDFKEEISGTNQALEINLSSFNASGEQHRCQRRKESGRRQATELSCRVLHSPRQ